MFPLGFAAPAAVIVLVGLYVAARELREAAEARGKLGWGPLVMGTGEGMLLLGALCLFLQGWVAGLVLTAPAAFVLFLGGAVLFFVGTGMESVRAGRR